MPCPFVALKRFRTCLTSVLSCMYAPWSAQHAFRTDRNMSHAHSGLELFARPRARERAQSATQPSSAYHCTAHGRIHSGASHSVSIIRVCTCSDCAPSRLQATQIMMKTLHSCNLGAPTHLVNIVGKTLRRRRTHKTCNLYSYGPQHMGAFYIVLAPCGGLRAYTAGSCGWIVGVCRSVGSGEGMSL